MTGFIYLAKTKFVVVKILFDQSSSVQGLEKEIFILVATFLGALMVSNLWFPGWQG